jgi:dihydroorotate dehydrogenase
MIYRLFVRPALYALPPETAHRMVMSGLGLCARLPLLLPLVRSVLATRDPALAIEAFGLRFANPIGVAAGLDKNAEAFEPLGALGFGFVEVGTLTAEAQPGNPQPRLFRLPKDRALINRMGFNNHGAAAAAERISRVRARRTLLGINIGKTKQVAHEAALEDYTRSATAIALHADYVVINVSSPNTPGLRDLQAVSALRPLLTRMRAVLDAARPGQRVPLLLKIAPDLSDEDIDAIAELALELRLDGIIATNTTVSRSGLSSPPAEVAACGAGGLSGAPLRARALAVLARLRARVGTRVVLVAVGGIESADDAWERICAGATLVQIYTGFIYEGPLLPQRIAHGIAQRARDAGFARVSDAIGSAVPPVPDRSALHLN